MKTTKREQKLTDRATKRLYDCIRDAVIASKYVDTYDDTDEPHTLEVDMSDEDACYVGPFIVTIQLKRDGMMEDAQQVGHTPEPWEWTFSGTAGRWILISSLGEMVQTGGPPDVPLSPDQVLIQAAPALLRALRATTIKGHYAECLAGQRGYGTCSPLCQQVRAAIAKAEGVAPADPPSQERE